MASSPWGRRLAARHVVRILHVHRPVARLELLTHELEGAGADGVGDLPKRIGFRGPLGHDERHQAGSLREPVEQQWERFLERTVKALSLPPVISLSVAASAWPNASRIVQRRSDATQSAPPTGI
jgi:hypothetical protein